MNIVTQVKYQYKWYVAREDFMSLALNSTCTWKEVSIIPVKGILLLLATLIEYKRHICI